MISFISGEVIASYEEKIVVLTEGGLGYSVYCNVPFHLGCKVRLFTAHIFKETAQEIYGFSSLLEKRLFELLLKVKGVGPKSSFSLIKALGIQPIFFAILNEDKKLLQKAPGIGLKVASQIILDLKNLIQDVVTDLPKDSKDETQLHIEQASNSILNETLLACKKLEFDEREVLVKANRLLSEKNITSAEQLVGLILKE